MRPSKRALTVAVVWMACLGGTAEARSVLVGWTDNSTTEGLFHIERATVPNPIPPATDPACIGATWTELTTVIANVTAFTDAGVVEGQSYCYRIKASNAGGPSAYTPAVGIAVPLPLPAPPAAPSNPTATLGP